MPYFYKRIERSSSVLIRIEADIQDQADEIFNRWIEDDRGLNSEKLDQILSENEHDIERWVYVPLEKNILIPDIQIDREVKEEEPKYDLHIIYKGGDCCNRNNAYFHCSLDKVLDELRKLNKNYILSPKIIPQSKECIEAARKHNVKLIWFEAERRK